MSFDEPIDPEDIVSDFLRVHLTDPRARAEATDTNTFDATSGQTEFTITAPTGNNVYCITSVTVEGVSKNKWLEYFWDYQNSKITFFTGITLDDEVIVTFKYGTNNWIYSGEPDKPLSQTNFPRISVFSVSGSGKRLGQYDAPVESSPVLQIDVWAKNQQTFTIGGRKYSNKYLSRYLGYQVTKAFEDNEEDLDPVLYNYLPIGTPRAAPYSIEFQAHHTIVEVNFKGLSLGRRVID